MFFLTNKCVAGLAIQAKLEKSEALSDDVEHHGCRISSSL